MEISDRKLQILQAIIVSYLETAEPVGSRTISKHFPLNLSPATIRNEMMDLEEMGLIEQPHTSAGRIPTALGYRLYVDKLMGSNSISDDQWKVVHDILAAKNNQLDSVLREIGDLLSTVTRYPAIVTTPHITCARLKHLQLIPLDEGSVVLVTVTDGNIVRNHPLPFKYGYTYEELLELSEVLNRNLFGLTLKDINLALIKKIKKETKMDQTTMDVFMDALQDTLQSADETDVYTTGTSNMLNFPEFSDVNRARGFMEFLQKKDEVRKLVDPDMDRSNLSEGEGAVRIAIGSENTVDELRDCSVITATYHYKDMQLGSISIVGPMRMDYDKVVGVLRHISNDFPALFDAKNRQSEEEKQ